MKQVPEKPAELPDHDRVSARPAGWQKPQVTVSPRVPRARLFPSLPRWNRLLGDFVRYALLLLIALICGLPLLWMALNSVKLEPEIWKKPPTFFPQTLTLENYRYIFRSTEIPDFVINSILVSIPTTLLVVLMGASAAYALARLDFPGGRWLSAMAIFCYLIPPILIAIPAVRVISLFQLSGKLIGLIPVYTALFLPFAIWILRSYFAGFPLELEDAARVDGATRFQAIYMVVLPQAIPGMIATALFVFNSAWGEYLFASLLIPSSDQATLSIGIAQLVGRSGQDTFWSVMMAGAIIMVLPVIGIFILLQRYLVAGWGGGAFK